MASANNEITVHDAATGQTIVREMTAEEKAAYEIIVEDAKQRELQAADAVEARKAPLRRLGLSDDEITLILGL